MSAPVVAVSGMAARALVRLDGVCRAFSGRPVLRGVSFEIAAGEFVALLGRSGSGKSTLLRAVAELDDDAEALGAIAAPRDVSVLFQDSRLLPWLDVLGNVTLGLKGSDVGARGRRALDDVGLGNRASAWPAVLSGGEQQRVALARSLVRDPRLLLADEPFGALDALTRGRMQALLAEVAAVRGPAVLLVTHDIDEALLLADRVLVMEDGRIVADRAVDLPRPRRDADAGFARLRADLLARIGAPTTA